MKNILSNKYFLMLSGVILGGVFIFAGMEKITNPVDFSKSIYNYKLIPPIFINVAAVTIPWVEVTTGILLLFGVYVKENAAILNSLLVIFIVMVIISISRGLNIDCGCFGTAGGSRVGWLKVLENTGLFLLGLHILLFSNPLNKEKQN